MSLRNSLKPGDICPDWCNSFTGDNAITEKSMKQMSLCLSNNREDGERVIGGENHHLVIFFCQMGEVSKELDIAELHDLDKNLQNFKDLDCGVVAITDVNMLTIKKWMKGLELNGPLGFPIISDNNNKDISKEFHILDEDSGMIHRAVFIVSSYKQECLECAKIVYIDIYPDFVERPIEDILMIVKNIQNKIMSLRNFLKPGDICPDWCNSFTGDNAITEKSMEQMSLCLSNNRGEGERVIGGENHHLVIFFCQMGDISKELDIAELHNIDNNLQHFKDLDCGVVAITDVNILTIKKWMKGPELNGPLGFPIISDNNNKDISKEFHVLDEENGMIHRAVFIVSSYKQKCLECAKIRYIDIYPDFVERPIEDILMIVKELSTDDFKKPDDPIKPDPIEPDDPIKPDPIEPEDPIKLDPIEPDDPIKPDPIEPDDPIKPDPIEPDDPIKPDPIEPDDPIKPDPIEPDDPIKPDPIEPDDPIKPDPIEPDDPIRPDPIEPDPFIISVHPSSHSSTNWTILGGSSILDPDFGHGKYCSSGSQGSIAHLAPNDTEEEQE